MTWEEHYESCPEVLLFRGKKTLICKLNAGPGPDGHEWLKKCCKEHCPTWRGA